MVSVEDTIGKIYGHVAHDTDRLCLEIFAESIKEAHHCGSRTWSITLLPDRIRLIVGHVVPCTLYRGDIWIVIDKRYEDTPGWAILDGSADWRWTSQIYFKSVPSTSGYYTPTASRHAETWQAIRPMHFALIKAAAVKYGHVYKQSKKIHSKAVLDYLRHRLNDPSIPDPVH